MAQYVVTTSNPLGNKLRVVVHSAVPIGTNAVGVTWQQALVDFQGSPFESSVPASVMPAGRQSELNAGQWYEWEDDVEVNAHSDTATKEAAVESFITAEEQKRLDQMAHKLRFFGYTGTV